MCALVLGSTAVLNVVLNLALVPTFGLIGAASATATSLVAGPLMNYVVARWRLDIEVAIWRLPRKR
jgi:O-antigen/teichoic acid export membrane protein